MTAIELRTEIMQLIKLEQDTSILEAIRTLLYKLRQADEGDDDLTDEEVAELEGRFQGKVKAHSREESMRIARGADKE